MFIYPKNILRGVNLTKAAVALRRESPNDHPDEIWMGYIENGEAKVVRSHVVDTTTRAWEDVFSLGAAKDIAVVFDGIWRQNYELGHIFTTTGEPWFVVLRPNGDIELMQNPTTIPWLIDRGASSIAAIRGWKSLAQEEDDQGIIIAYTKNNWGMYSQAIPTAIGGLKIEPPQTIPDSQGVEKISLFVTNDYRAGFLLERDGKLELRATTRTWAGLGVGNQGTVTLSVEQGVEILFEPIEEKEIDLGTETVQLHVPQQDIFLGLDEPLEQANGIIAAHNPDAYTIEIQVQRTILHPDRRDFRVVDSLGIPFIIVSVEPMEPGVHGAQWFRLRMDSINNAYGDVTVKFTGLGDHERPGGGKWPPFEGTFTPQGLVPEPTDPPVPVRAYNIRGNRWT